MRYAVVGAGHIAQAAVLPAFANARRNSRLTAIVSGNPRKLSTLAELYGVDHAFDYDQYSEACASGVFDAVYIALPNSMHCEFACQAAEHGIHVLCEKPMAVSGAECREMIACAGANGVKLMVAYRLHFEAANLRAIELAEEGQIGDPRLFNSVFSMQVREGNIRTRSELGGGPLFDLGVYCINAARYLFRNEPLEVAAFASEGGDDPRFAEVEEAISAVLRFPRGRLATFSCSFGAADASHFQLIGTRGDVRADPAYEYNDALRLHVTIDGETRERRYPRRDQFGPELLYFSECILDDREPEPGAIEGLIDVMVMESIFESVQTGRAVALPPLPPDDPPEPDQEIRRRPVRKRRLVEVESAHVE